MNPQGTPEHNTQAGEQLPTPNPVRTETLADLDTARGLIHSTGCSPEEYNSCTEDFEAQREQCRDECMASRRELLGEVELQNKDISDLTIDEAKQVLALSQEEYQIFPEEKLNKIKKGLAKFTNSFNSISNSTEANIFQEKLLKKIYGEDFMSDGFSSELVLGFSKEEGGNHVKSISDFEQQLNSGEAINPKILANYLQYLIHERGISYDDLAYHLRDRNLEAINSLLGSSTDPSITILREGLKNNGVFENGVIVDSYWRDFQNFSQKIVSGEHTLGELLSKINDANNRREDKMNKSPYSQEDITAIAERSLHEDITGLLGENEDSNLILQEIIEARTKILKDRFLASLEEIYGEIPYVMNYFQRGVNNKVGFDNFDAESMFGNLSYVNTQISRHNLKTENEVPLIDGTWKISIQQSFVNLHTTIVSNGSIDEIIGEFNSVKEEIQKIYSDLRGINTDISQEMKQGNTKVAEELKKQRDELQQKLGQLKKTREDYRLEIEKIDAKIESSQTVLQSFNMKNTFEWNDENINYILEEPENRIGIINEFDALKRFLTENQELVEAGKIPFMKLNIAFQKDIGVLRAYGINNLHPYEGDYSRIGRDSFLANKAFSYDVLKGNDGKMLLNLLASSENGKDFCRELLIKLKAENSEAGIFTDLPYSIIRYDREQNDGRNFSLGISLKESTGLTYEEIRALKSEGRLETLFADIEGGLEEYIEQKSHIIDLYFIENPNSDLTLGEKSISKNEFYSKCISLGYFPLLESVYFNPALDPEIVKEALSYDITSMYLIDPTLLGKPEIRNHILSIIKKEDLDLLTKIQILKDNGTFDAVGYLKFGIEIYKKFGTKVNTGDDTGYIDEVHSIVSSISNEDYERYIAPNKELDAFYEQMIGMMGLLTHSRETMEVAKESKESNESISFQETKSYLLENGIDEKEDIPELIEIFDTGVIIDTRISMILKKYPELSDDFFEELKQKIRTDAQRKVEDAQSKVITSPIKDSVSDLFITNEEGSTIDPKALQESFKEFRRENKEQFPGYLEALSAYLTSLEVTPEDEEYERIHKLLSGQSAYVNSQLVQPKDFLDPPKNFGDDFGLPSCKGEWYTPNKDSNTITDTAQERQSTRIFGETYEQISTSSDGKSYIDGGDLGKISISEQEANIIRGNPNVADTIVDNIVNMYTFFKDLNLLGVWDYRFELVNAVGSVHINIQDDFLNETELLNFGKKILKLINKINEEEAKDGEVPEKVIENPIDLASLNYELSKFSKSRELWGDEKSFNSYGEGRFESWMRNYGIIGGITFHTSTVREMMN